MGKIIISENVSLDGVIQDPTGDEDFERGGWGRIADEDREAWATILTGEALAADALLLGRRTYEFFATRFPARGGAWADRLNTMPKHVVSTTLHDPGWPNSTVLTGDVPAAVAALKRNVRGDIVVYASGPLVHTLLEHDLADELRLMTFPYVVGAGNRLFGATSDGKPMRLVGTRGVGAGLALHTYRAVGAA
jgi:dihydrofolate reductase